jgi:hypothetical protein
MDFGYSRLGGWRSKPFPFGGREPPKETRCHTRAHISHARDARERLKARQLVEEGGGAACTAKAPREIPSSVRSRRLSVEVNPPPKKELLKSALASRGGAKRTRAWVALRAAAEQEGGEAARAIVEERSVLACRGEGCIFNNTSTSDKKSVCKDWNLCQSFHLSTDTGRGKFQQMKAGAAAPVL